MYNVFFVLPKQIFIGNNVVGIITGTLFYDTAAYRIFSWICNDWLLDVNNGNIQVNTLIFFMCVTVL